MRGCCCWPHTIRFRPVFADRLRIRPSNGWRVCQSLGTALVKKNTETMCAVIVSAGRHVQAEIFHAWFEGLKSPRGEWPERLKRSDSS
jgi:hypothetical protein